MPAAMPTLTSSAGFVRSSRSPPPYRLLGAHPADEGRYAAVAAALVGPVVVVAAVVGVAARLPAGGELVLEDLELFFERDQDGEVDRHASHRSV
jgi:hypothetical protein